MRFGPEYGDLPGLLMDASELDWRLLADLPRPVWDSIAAALQARLTDAVIEDAVRQSPPEYHDRVGAELVRGLQGRRDGLPEAARRFCAVLAREVGVHASDADEHVQVERLPDRSVDVEIRILRSESGAADGRRSLFRRFDPADTREIRVFLHGGGDHPVVRGDARRSPRVRVIGGGGDDMLVDSSRVSGGRKTVLYDRRGANGFEPGGEAVVDRREPLRPGPPDSALHNVVSPPRDWGAAFSPFAPHAEWQAHVGPVLGFGPVWTTFGFLRQPYARSVALRLLWTPLEWRGYGAEAVYDRRWTNSPGRARVRAANSAAARFHGFGNDTPDSGARERFVVSHTQIAGDLRFSIPLVRSGRVEASVGPAARWTDPDPEPGSVVSEHQPRGAAPFVQAGAVAGVRAGLRDAPAFPRRGVRADLGVEGYTWSGGAPFAAVRADVASYAPLPLPGALSPVLAVRAGGIRAFGDFPFQEAVRIGGSETLRGFATARFAGETAVYGNAELRPAKLAPVRLLARGDLGAFVLADAGGVYLGSASPGGWHTALGGGMLFTTLGRVAGLTYARGDAHRVYLQMAVPF